MNAFTLGQMSEADRATYVRGRARDLDVRMRDVHDRLYAFCRRYRAFDDAIAVDHGRRYGAWSWYGCADHCPSTSSGIASDRMVDQAREALRNAR